MKRLKIDEKWSVDYDDRMNDRPVTLFRYEDTQFTTDDWKNDQVAMFYALLEAHQKAERDAELMQEMVEAITGSLEQMLQGHWVDDHGRPAMMNASQMKLASVQMKYLLQELKKNGFVFPSMNADGSHAFVPTPGLPPVCAICGGLKETHSNGA